MNSTRSCRWKPKLPFAVLYVAVSVITFASFVDGEQNRPRVFITDSESWEIVGSAAGSGGTFAGHTQGGARPQTAEVIKTFGERCPQVLVNNKQEKADYVVVLDHEGGKGYLSKRNKIAVFNKEGDAIVSRSTRSLGNSVQDACDAIVANWSGHGVVAASPAQASPLLPSAPPTSQPETHPASVVPTAKREPETSVQPVPAPATVKEKADAATSVIVGTVSVTSDPDGAEMFIDSVGYGHAPAILKLPHGRHAIQLVMQGYKDWTSDLEVRENSIVNVTAKLEK
jgi:PEGA domain